jgi:hypothetical protein
VDPFSQLACKLDAKGQLHLSRAMQLNLLRA